MTIILTIYALWVFYLAVMSLLRAHRAGVISKWAMGPAYLTLLIGAVLDVIVNVLVMTVVLFERPKEFFVTQRLTRHIKESAGWRRSISQFVCRNYLNAFDPTGNHCD